MKRCTSVCIFLFFAALLALAGPHSKVVLYVSPSGTYGNPGTIKQPTTLEGARDKIRELSELPPNGVLVCLRGGTYSRTDSFVLTHEDSGTAQAPIIYRSHANEVPILQGAIQLDAGGFSRVDSSEGEYSRLHSDAEDQVFKIDLTQYTSDFGSMDSRAMGFWAHNRYLELFCGDSPMQLARYPDYEAADLYKDREFDSLLVEGTGAATNLSGIYTHTGTDDSYPVYEAQDGSDAQIYVPSYSLDYHLVADGNTWLDSSGAGALGFYRPWGDASGEVMVSPPDGSRIFPGFALTEGTDGASWVSCSELPLERWGAASNLYAMGFWHYTFSADYTRAFVNEQDGTLTLSSPRYGCGTGKPFFVLNLLEEISRPGEWYLDTDSGTLYFWPPSDGIEEGVYISILQDPLIHVDGARHVKFQGVTLEMTRGDLVLMKGDNVALEGCTLRNCGGAGAVVDGESSGLNGCKIYQIGSSGVQLSGGDRYTLEPGNNYVRNCEIYHFGRLFWTYHPGIYIRDPASPMAENSVGLIVAHNHIHHGAHSAIIYTGNDHSITFNNIHDVCEWSGDSGAIYIWKGWDARGTEIAYNFIHNIKSQGGTDVFAVYLDDGIGGTTIRHNIFYDSSHRFPVFLGGGRDNRVYNNIMDGSAYAAFIDDRALKAISDESPVLGDPLWRLLYFNYQEAPWSVAYPELALLPSTGAELDGTHWLQPENTLFATNVYTCTREMIRDISYSATLPDPAELLIGSDLNLQVVDMGYINERRMNLSLRKDSPVYDGIPGFEAIPFREIGVDTVNRTVDKFIKKKPKTSVDGPKAH